MIKPPENKISDRRRFFGKAYKTQKARRPIRFSVLQKRICRFSLPHGAGQPESKKEKAL
jgi:hypothetical protein